MVNIFIHIDISDEYCKLTKEEIAKEIDKHDS